MRQGLLELGCTSPDSAFFDTIAVSPPPGSTAADVLAAGHKHGVNFRQLDEATLTLSCDETTTAADLALVFEAFAMGKQVPFTLASLFLLLLHPLPSLFYITPCPDAFPPPFAGPLHRRVARRRRRRRTAIAAVVAAHFALPHAPRVQQPPFGAPDASIHFQAGAKGHLARALHDSARRVTGAEHSAQIRAAYSQVFRASSGVPCASEFVAYCATEIVAYCVLAQARVR